jgi:RNA-directed DNA polymerase
MIKNYVKYVPKRDTSFPITDWNAVNWKLTSDRVFKIQCRIFQAKRCQNNKRLHWLQHLLVNSISARLLAVHRVTTLNKGKRTAGFDRTVAHTPVSKLRLAQSISLDGKALPIRRVWLLKPGKTEKRPLGIPILHDRAKQMLAKLALEPEWEAVFEPNSYGFRPGRSCHDAMEAIFRILHNGIPKLVFDADIAKCFDRIDHQALTRKLETFPEMERQVSAWLKCGAIEEFAKSRAELKAKEITPTESGTPQGGVISPLLANIALHGLELHLREMVGRRPGPSNRVNRGYNAKAKSLGFVRYADDFVILHDNREILNKCIVETRKWLAGMGLEISEEKSAVRDVREGFQFLGFQVIMLKRKYGNLKYKTLIRPATSNTKRFLHKVKVVIARNKASSSYDLIEKLRPIIFGWANYFRYCECMKDFLKVQHMIHLKLRAWVFRRSTRVGRRATKQKYFPRGEYFFDGRKRRADWVLVGRKITKEGIKTNFLPYLTWVQSKKHVKVKGDESPYNPSSGIYWAIRMTKSSSFPTRISFLLKRQGAKCPICNSHFTPLDIKEWEIDHITPRSEGGPDIYDNLQLIHKACHIKKTRADSQRGSQ